MNTLFHITKNEYVDDIMKYGLIPERNMHARFDVVQHSELSGVYMTPDYATILSIDSSFSPGEYTIMEVNITNIKSKLIRDSAYDLEEETLEEFELENNLSWYYQGNILPNNIKVIGTAVLEHQQVSFTSI